MSYRLIHFGKIVIITVEVILLVVLLFWRFKLGLTRYFDADEFAHLHWGYSLLIGEKPYTDFFYLFPPFFLYPIATIFAIFGRSISALIEARVFIFIIFLATSAVLFLWARKLRNMTMALLTVCVFAFLPLPSDKMIEVRPDNLAVFFSLLGLYLFILGNENGKKKYFFFSGLCYSTSLCIVPKTLFFLLPPVVALSYKIYRTFSLRRSDLGRGPTSMGAVFFLLGFLPSLVVLFLLIFSYGNPLFAIYSMTKMANEITWSLALKFYMRPDIFFYPNETYYGIGGNSWPYLFNLVIYISASLFAITRFLSSLSYPDNKKCLREFLFASTFFINLYAFVQVFPLKHAQYLIPLAPFIAFYFADLIETFTNYKLLKLKIPLVLLVVSLIAIVGKQMYERKIQWTNKLTFQKINKLIASISKDTAVFDLTGESIFFPNGHYFCCLPYGQYQESLFFKLPNIEQEMEKRGTKYVYTGNNDRLNVIPSLEAKYIRENFIPYFPDGSLMRKK